MLIINVSTSKKAAGKTTASVGIVDEIKKYTVWIVASAIFIPNSNLLLQKTSIY